MLTAAEWEKDLGVIQLVVLVAFYVKTGLVFG
jgi:hypothetical protein